MARKTSRRRFRSVGISWRGVLGPSWLDNPHATDIAAACTALDYGCAAWFSHQIDEVIARDEEGNLAAEGSAPAQRRSR